MILLNDPIIETVADVIVIPCEMYTREIVEGSLHHEFAQSSPRSYLGAWFAHIRESMHPGAVRSFKNEEGRWKGTWFIHFPVSRNQMLGSWRHSMDKVVNLTRALDVDHVAIPKLGNAISWDMQEFCFEMAEKQLDRGQEVWAYSPEEEFGEDDEDEVDDPSFNQMGVLVRG